MAKKTTRPLRVSDLMRGSVPFLPTIVFGAFDRHNFGDFLFAHIAARLLGNAPALRFAGLAERDLRPFGGHHIESIVALSKEYAGQAVDILHAGGELLTCSAWEAAVMLLPPEQAARAIAAGDQSPEARLAWARALLGRDALAPYTVERSLFPHAHAIAFNAIGGVELDMIDPAMRAEVLTKLRAANYVSVREHRTQATLSAAGIACVLVPDPAAMTAELFAPEIDAHARRGEAAQVIEAFPQGYIAVQFSADFGDEATLGLLAAQLDDAVAQSSKGIVFFRAGAAPWHDDIACYQRLASRMQTKAVRLFHSLDTWDICALIAHSSAYCGSSLHGRIIAMSFALPRVNLIHPTQAPGKLAAYSAAWEQHDMPTVVEAGAISTGIGDALNSDVQLRHQTAAQLASLYREEFAALRRSLA